jgi:formylglycine-generating enzyme required for sulfatase activity
VTPIGNLSWFQANIACASSGKRLLTNAEWQAASAGTVDPGFNDGTSNTACNTSGPAIRNTGLAGDQATGCVSAWGVEDMVGNTMEWVADWVLGQDDPVNGIQGSAFGNDRAKLGARAGTAENPSDNFAAAIIRGGGNLDGTEAGAFFFDAFRQPTFHLNNIGFRCAKPL